MVTQFELEKFKKYCAEHGMSDSDMIDDLIMVFNWAEDDIRVHTLFDETIRRALALRPSKLARNSGIMHLVGSVTSSVK